LTFPVELMRPFSINAVIPGREQHSCEASPESIITAGIMDSGPARKGAHPGMTTEMF
jgi:hypothetical protein